MTEFITNCIIDKPFKVEITDKSVLDIYIKLSVTNVEIAKIGFVINKLYKL